MIEQSKMPNALDYLNTLEPKVSQEPQNISKFNKPGDTNYTEQELDIARQIKEQGGTKEDFINEIDIIRKEEFQGEEDLQPDPIPDLMTKKEIAENNNNDKSFVSPVIESVGNIASKVPSAFNAFGEGIDNLIGGAISSTPKIVGNTAGAITSLAGSGLGMAGIDKGEELLKSLGDQFVENGINTQESLQDFLDINNESKMAKIGEIGAEIAAVLSPTPAGKGKVALGAKELATKGRTLLEGIKGGKTAASLLNIGSRGAVLGAKTEAVNEGELTSEGISEGAVLELGFAGLGKIAKTVVPKKTVDGMKDKIKERISSLIKIPTGKTSATSIAKEIDNGADAITILKQRNPSFKIQNTDNALRETLEEVGTSKSSIFKEYDEILKANNVNVGKDELVDEVLKIADNSDFQTLVRNTSKVKGTETAAFDILEKKLKNADMDRSILELYDDTKLLQTNLKGLFNQSNKKDALESIVDLQVLKAYNNVIEKKIGSLKGTEFNALKKQYGALKSFEESIGRKYKSLLRKSSSGLHNYADAFLDSELVTSALRGDVVGFSKAGLTKLFRNEFTKLGDPNQILSKVFKSFDDIIELESNPIKAKLKEKFKGISKEITKAATVKEFIDNE